MCHVDPTLERQPLSAAGECDHWPQKVPGPLLEAQVGSGGMAVEPSAPARLAEATDETLALQPTLIFVNYVAVFEL